MNVCIVKILAAALIVTALTACSGKYFVVKQEFLSNETLQLAEITKAKSYQNAIKAVKVIAVQAPDHCNQETASQRSGEQVSNATIFFQRCGVHMADIERGLARVGYEVVSWKEFLSAQQLGAIGSGKSGDAQKLTPVEAARNLKVDAILLINSLEATQKELGKDGRLERRFYQSNLDGDILEPANVDMKLKKQFDEQLNHMHSGSNVDKKLSATVNATMILVETGRSVWFYEWTVAETDSAQYDQQLHLVCKGECSQVVRKKPKKTPVEKVSSGETIAVSRSGGADTDRQEYERLMKILIADLLNKFSEG